MSATFAQDAIIKRLKAMPGRPNLTYENDPKSKPTPRIVIGTPPASQRKLGGSTTTQGTAEIVARVEVEDGKLDLEAKAIVEAIVAQFSVGVTFDNVTVEDAPNPAARYQEDGVYHIPVIIRANYQF